MQFSDYEDKELIKGDLLSASSFQRIWDNEEDAVYDVVQ